jgi:hypothetical protein
MAHSERLARAAAALIGLATAAVVLSPLADMDNDSFPISSYPMFARPRGQPTLYAVTGRRRDGSELRLPAEVIGSTEVLQTKVLIQRSVDRGPDAMRELCRGVAGRVAQSPARYGSPASIEIVRRRYDPIAYFERGPEPIEQERLMHCKVPRQERAGSRTR